MIRCSSRIAGGLTLAVGLVILLMTIANAQVLSLVGISGDISEGTSTTSNTTQNIMVKLYNSSGAEITAAQLTTANYSLSGVEANVSRDVKLASDAPGRISDSSGKITIAQGSNSAVIPLEIIADKYDEIDETFTLSLSSPTAATVGTRFTNLNN